jgi:hypothetical protein
MTDTTETNTKPLIDTEEVEHEISLVSSEQQHEDVNNLLVATDKTATLASNVSSEWDEQPATKKGEHPLSSAVVVEEYEKDPWAQPENSLLTKNDPLDMAEEEEDEEEEEEVEQQEHMLDHQREEPPAIATTSVFDEYDNAQSPPAQVREEQKDQDTSAIKVHIKIKRFL